MSDRVYTQDEVFTAVRRLLKKYHAERAILFGSYARQEANAASDIDLIVVGGSRFDRRFLHSRGTASRLRKARGRVRAAGA